MAGGNSAASSLYAGIFGSQAGTSSQAQPSASTSASTDDAASEKNSAAAAAAESASSSKPQVWSAALRFAPRKNLNANKGKRPAASLTHLSAAFAAPSSSESNLHGDDASSQPSMAPAPHSNAPSQVKDDSAQSLPKPQHDIQTRALNLGRHPKDVRPLPIVTEPPALSLPAEEIEHDRLVFRLRAERRGERDAPAHADAGLGAYIDGGEDEDVNGFAQTAEGRKARKKKRRRRNGSPGHHGGLVASLNMDADYDPHVPNDFDDFKTLIKKRRAAMRKYENAKNAAKRQEDGDDSDDSDDSDDDSNDEVHRQRRKMGHFAPPAMYSADRSGPTIADRTNHDWPVVEEDEKPYLSPPPAPPGPPPTRPPLVRPAVDTSGEEAYQRRLAMSQQLLQSSSANPLEQVEATSQPTPMDFAARAAAASAIAARLAKIAPGPTAGEVSAPAASRVTARESQTHDPSTFAERLMIRQGWAKGQALGAEGNKGILDPIMARKVEEEHPAVKSHHRSGDERHTTASGPRGTLVNARDEEQRCADRRRYGEASNVLLLENMISGDDEIDDDLPGEIQEECAKYGYVDRVFVWPAASARAGQPRVFVQFTGMAGAWRCLKELDGRFFAGNTVHVRYYPPVNFARGQYDIAFRDEGDR